MSRHPCPAKPTSALTIPQKLWYLTPVHTNVVHAARPRPSRPTRLMPLVAMVGSYTSARASTAHLDAAAAALLLLAFAALVAFGVGMARYGAATVRHHPIGRSAMSAGSTLPLWLRLGGPTGAVLGGGGAVAAGVYLTAVAAALVSLAAAAVAVTLAGLLRSRS